MAISQVVAVKASGGAQYNSVPPNVKSSGAGGNGGAVVNGGSGGSGLLDNVASVDSGEAVFGSTVVDGVNAGKALGAGTFASNSSEFIAKRVTDVLAGSVSNTILRSGAAVPANIQSVHKYPATFATRKLTTAIRAGNWNIYTGKFSSVTVEAADAFVNIDSGSTLDKAANPSRSEPGRLVFKTGAPAPSETVYKAKTA